MGQARFDNNLGTVGGSVQTADAETGRTLLSDGQKPAPDGQVKAPGTADQTTVGTNAAGTADQTTVGTNAAAGTKTVVDQDQAVKDMLAHAKILKANVVEPDQVISMENVDFTKRPAWNPQAVEHGPIDTIDDLTLDRQGKIKINPSKKGGASPSDSISIGIEADAVHWSPLYLPLAQEQTVRDTVSYLHENNPGLHVPAPLEDVPWQCLSSLPAQGAPEVDPALFKNLLDQHKLKDRIVTAVAGNEGNLDTVTTDDAGYGWSVGMRQWNQHVGELPALLGAMYKKDPCTFVKDFGPYAAKMINNVGDPANATVNTVFIRHADFSAMLGFADAKHKQVNHVQDVEKALNDFQSVQVALSRQLVTSGVRLAQKYGFKSELGWAEVCDMVNQKGAGGTEKVLKQLPKAAGATELSRIEEAETLAARPGGKSRLANLEKKFSVHKDAKSEP
jgi:hypothetical protein